MGILFLNTRGEIQVSLLFAFPEEKKEQETAEICLDDWEKLNNFDF